MTKKVQSLKKITVSTDKTIAFQLTIKTNQAKKEYQNILSNAAKQIKIKGFRTGKAPLDRVEKELSLSKLYQDIVQNLLPQKYADVIAENKIKPIIRPQITLSNPPLSLDKDWLFEIKTCQKPEIKLATHQAGLKKLNQQKHDTSDRHNQAILELLSSKATVIIPQVLLDTQIKERLVRLIDSASQVGLTVDQYLAGKKTNINDYRQNIKNNLIKEWKINLSLDKIADRQNIKVTPADIKKATPKQSANSQPTNFISYILRQQKTLDFLKTVK